MGRIIEQADKKGRSNIKRHLTDINGDTAITVNNDESDPLPEGLPEGTKVTISPDSDGKLAFQTLKIAQTLKPKVIILENVSTFGQADIEDEDEVPSEFITEEKTITTSRSAAMDSPRCIITKPMRTRIAHSSRNSIPLFCAAIRRLFTPLPAMRKRRVSRCRAG